MGTRLELQTVLENILGSSNVYFQPPPSKLMSYPAIVYRLGRIKNDHANNAVYRQQISYEVTYVHWDPDDEITYVLSKLPLCQFEKRFSNDNLYHDVFTLFY